MRFAFLAGLVLVINHAVAAAAGEGSSISTPHLKLEYDAARGEARVHVAKPASGGGGIQLTGELETGDEIIALGDARFERRVTTGETTEPLLAGPALRVQGIDTKKQLDWTLELGLLAERRALVARLVATNRSTTAVVIKRLQPARVLAAARDVKVLTHGRMYYDPGQLFDLAPGGKPINSVYNAAIHSAATSKTLVVGFLDLEKVEGRIRTEWAPENDGKALHISADALAHSRVTVGPGESFDSGRVLYLLSDDGHEALETYATLLGKLHKIQLNRIINGWCTWFVYYGDYTAEDVRKNAEFVARELAPYGMEWIQVDDGYQRAFGDWEGQPAKFPQGMKGVADEIKKLGLRAGIWLAPFAISANAPVAKEHPEWLAKRATGEPQQIEQAHQAQAQLILDSTHPGARQWLKDLFRTVSEEWGYDFIKTDFVEWTILAAEQYHRRDFTTAMAYRDGVAAQREGMGPKRHLLDCGPGPIVAGLIDSMRVGLDRPVPENPLWIQYGGYYNSTGGAVARRYYFHNRVYISDPDHLRVGGLTMPQAQAAASIVALSGGTMMSGDKLFELPAEKVDVLRKVLPSSGQAARPLDLFENNQPELFLLPVKIGDDEYKVLGAFNWGEDVRTRAVDLKAREISASKDPLVFDFWKQELVPVTSAVLELQHEPTSVRLVSIHERKPHPQVVGTDRHVTQGLIESESITWSEDARTLTGVSKGANGTSWTLNVHVPEGFEVKEAVGLEKHVIEQRLLRAVVKFVDSDRVEWALKF